MKAPFLLTLTLCLAFSVRAQTPATTLSSEQLDQLLGPIALYPDALIALILPASTFPSDLATAADYLASNGSLDGIDAQPWDLSVKGLARYPDVVKWMNSNFDWMQTLSVAFTQQPAEVMKSIQQLRVQAQAAGNLVDTPQQQVDQQGDSIRIIPTQPDTIFVPEYDPDVVYETPVSNTGPLITFGPGFPVGAWLGFQCDWDDFGIWVGPWSPGWNYRRQWRHPVVGGEAWRVWRPDPGRFREAVRSFHRPEGRPPVPTPAAGYRAPIRQPYIAPHPMISHAPARPDYRGREVATPRPPVPSPSSQLLRGYNRGTQTRDFSNRGQASRSAPVRTPAASRAAAPTRAAAPARAPAPTATPGQTPPDKDKRDRH